MPGLKAVLESLDPEPWRRGQAFEKLAKKWLEVDPLWSGKFSNLWHWDEWPGRSGPDIGVDIVAESTDGLWAIQVKCFEESASIPKSELDSFMAAASHKVFQHRMLIATTNKLSNNATKALEAQEVIKVLREDLENSPVSWGSLSSSNKPLVKTAQPRAHQLEAVESVVAKFRFNPKGQLHMACGTGKTLTSLWIKEALDSRLTLVLVPSLSLLSQTLRSWAGNRNETWDYLAVCSDSTVDQGNDEFVGKTSDLPFSVTTNPEVIRAFLKRPGNLVVFGTYQSSDKIAEACGRDIAFDFVVCDEAHKLAGKLKSTLKTVLDEDKLPRKLTLFQTATPRVFNSSVKAKLEGQDLQVASMDDYSIFGEPFHQLSFGEAIARDLLTDYRVVVTLVTDDEVGTAIRNRLLLQGPDGIMNDANVVASAIGVMKIMHQHSLARAISFHSSVRRASNFANLLSKLANSDSTALGDLTFRSKVIHGEMNVFERRLLLNELQSGSEAVPYVLTNAKCLTEGVDVPTLDAVAFVDPKQSTGDIVQAVGRAIRKSDTKEKGWIVLPLHVRGQAESIDFDETDFTKIWHVVNALRSHDELLADELDSIRRELGELGTTTSRISKMEFDFPHELIEFEEAFADSITGRIVQFASPVWEEWFGLLLRFVKEFGTADVPSNTEYEGKLLGRWVSSQRSHLQVEAPTEVQANRSARLGELPGWIWNSNDANWSRRLAALTNYAEEYGNARPPIDLIYQGEKLGDFVRVLRWGYKSYGLDPERIEMLEGLPGWAWNKYDGDWLDFYESTRSFISRHGRSPLSNSKDKAERSLKMWIGTQRRYKEKLSPQKIEALELLPFWSWDPNADSWNRHLSHALQLLASTGTISIPRGQKSEYPGLVTWIGNQKKALAANEMSDERRSALLPLMAHLEIKSSETRSEETFNRNFGILQRFLQVHDMSELNTSKTEFENLKLGSWVQRQREKKNLGILTAPQISRLESLIGWDWSPKANSWNEQYQELAAFERVNGHLVLDQKVLPRLAEWLKDQRKIFVAGKMDPERTRRLESLPGWAWDSCDLSLDVALQALKQFAASNGHCDIGAHDTVNGFPLGKWKRVMRTLYSKQLVTKPTAEKIQLVEGWSWDRKG